MSGCSGCGCYRRGASERAEQETAWATYRDNVDYSEGWTFIGDDGQLVQAFNATFDVQRWYDVH